MLTDISGEDRILTELVADREDRHAGGQIKTPYRLVKVENDRNRGLARCRNLSDGGAKLDLAMALNLNDRVTISLTPTAPIDGRVIWISGNGCGIAFDEPIDSTRLLRGDVLENGQFPISDEPWDNPARRRINVPAKIANDGNFHPGLNVRVILADGREREGMVQWSKDNIAGVVLLAPAGTDESGRRLSVGPAC